MREQKTGGGTEPAFEGADLWVPETVSKPRTPTSKTSATPAALDAELRRARRDYNRTRLHAGIGYVTPDDEHTGREANRSAKRAEGLRRAREQRLGYHRRNHNPQEPA